MKKSIIYIACAAMALVACKKEELAGNGEFSEDKTVTTISVDVQDIESKTGLNSSGEVVWWAGDQICVNGVISKMLTQYNSANPKPETDFAYKKSASFKFTEEITGPYKAINPAKMLIKLEDETSYDMDYILVPDAQTYRANSWGPSANVMIGTGDNGKISFKHASSFIKIIPNVPEGKTLDKVEFISNKEAVSGKFAINYEDGTISPVEEVVEATEEDEDKTKEVNSTTITLTKNSNGDALGNVPSFILAIPAQTYTEGFKIRIYTTDGIYTTKSKNSSWEARPGYLTTLADDMDSENKDTEISEEFKIYTADDWHAFVLGVESGSEAWKNVNVTLCNDITIVSDIEHFHLSSNSAAKTYVYGGVFDGNNNTINRKKPRCPLFGTVTGTIKNLTLTGNEDMDPGAATHANAGAATLAAILDGGVIDNCTNNINIKYSGSVSLAMGGFVRTMLGGRIENCTNNGNLEATMDIVTNTTHNFYAGGIVAQVYDATNHSADKSIMIKNCINNGSVKIILDTYDETSTASAEKDKFKAYIGINGLGGIAGIVNAGNATNYATFEECTNIGNVTYDYNENDPISATGRGLVAGGIIGTGSYISSIGELAAFNDASKSHSYIKIDGCNNSGTIYNGGVSSANTNQPFVKDYVGGIAGVLFGLQDQHSVMVNCTNTGKVLSNDKTAYSRTSVCTIVGGLAGAIGRADLSNCTVGELNKAVELGNINRQTFAVGGFVGTPLSEFNIDGCKVNADVYHYKTSNTINNTANNKLGVSNHTGNSYPTFTNSTISNCFFKGSITSAAAAKYTTVTAPTEGSITTTTVDASNFSSNICNSATGVTVSGATYWQN